MMRWVAADELALVQGSQLNPIQGINQPADYGHVTAPDVAAVFEVGADGHIECGSQASDYHKGEQGSGSRTRPLIMPRRSIVLAYWWLVLATRIGRTRPLCCPVARDAAPCGRVGPTTVSVAVGEPEDRADAIEARLLARFGTRARPR